jgi:hypothetical protein
MVFGGAVGLASSASSLEIPSDLSKADKEMFTVSDQSVQEVALQEEDWQLLLNSLQNDSDTLTSTKSTSLVAKDNYFQEGDGYQDDEDEDDDDKSIDTSTIANIGKLAADFIRFIEDRAPVAEAKSYTANGLPSGAESVDILANLSELNVKKYEYRASNVIGIPLYTAEFLVAHRHGGTYKDEGQFLANVTIVPVSAWAPFLFNVHVDAGNVQVNNVGSAESPVAGLTLEVQIAGKGLFSSTIQKVFYEFRGDSEAHKMHH